MMIRRMRHAAALLAMACMMTVIMPAQVMTAFAANARIAFSDPSATVGGKIKVNMKITSSDNLASADVMLSYDSSLLEFVDGTNATGDAGAVRVHGDAGTPNTGTLAFTLNFNAIAAGTSKIEVTSQEIYDSGSQIVTVNQQGSSTVTVSALQSASKDATLKNLQVSPGTLTPAFSPDVDTYAVTVGTDVDKVIISADSTDENATKVVAGNEGLQMGENRVTCRVTAQDGETTREYVIVVTKAEGGASAASADTSTQVKMRIAERNITILSPDPEVPVPEGFKSSVINIDGNKVQGWVWGSEAKHEYCVVYGMNEAGEKGFYRYDMKDGERTIQRYFEDPAISGSVSKEVYDELAVTYDRIYSDYGVMKMLLIATIIIAVILLIIILVIVFVVGVGRKDKDRDSGDDRKSGSRASRSRKNRTMEDLGDTDREDAGDEYEDEYGDEDGYEEDYEDSESYEDSDEYEDDPGFDEDEDEDYRDQDYGDEEYDSDEDDLYEPKEDIADEVFRPARTAGSAPVSRRASKAPASNTSASKAPAVNTSASKTSAVNTSVSKASAVNTSASKTSSAKAPSSNLSAPKAPVSGAEAAKTSVSQTPVPRTSAQKQPAQKAPAREPGRPVRKEPVQEINRQDDADDDFEIFDL